MSLRVLTKFQLQGPGELLGFVKTQIESELDAARTAAFIVTDLAVEILLKNTIGVSRSMRSRFFELVNELQSCAPNAFHHTDPQEFLHWHELRNDLQHKHRNTVTVNRSDLVGYFEAALKLYQNLGGTGISVPQGDSPALASREFNLIWMEIESELNAMRIGAEKRWGRMHPALEPNHVVDKWFQEGRIDSTAATWFPIVSGFRHKLVDPIQQTTVAVIRRHCVIAELVLEVLKERATGPS